MRRVLFVLLSIAAPAAAQEWTVAERIALPLEGPIDLASVARPDEDPMRIVITGSYTFLLDGSEIDAVGVEHGDRREAGVVALPPGSRVIDSDPVAHRYTIEIPRAASMPMSLRIGPLAMRHLITVSEARANLQGAIHVEHLVPPPPPPPAMAVVASEASNVPIVYWLAGVLGIGLIGAGGVWQAQRRREPVAILVRRAQRARRAIARECATLGPAFDPVSASALRLLEATEQTAAHDRALAAAIARTEWAAGAKEDHAKLLERKATARKRLIELVTRLEQTATQLAGRSADAARAMGVDSLLDELGTDLDAASEAEEELAHIG